MSKIGPSNVTAQHNATASGLPINETINSAASAAGPVSLGHPHFIGVIVLLLLGIGLWRLRASLDTSTGVMTVALLVLARQGYLPNGDGIIFVLLLAVAALFGLGVASKTLR